MATIEIKLACPGCCGSGGFQVQCRDRTGTAELIGYAEFINPTVPPKLYRKKTYSGSMQMQTDGRFPDCCEFIQQASPTGVNAYNPVTGVLVLGASYAWANTCSRGPSDGDNSSGVVSPFDASVSTLLSSTAQVSVNRTSFVARAGTLVDPCGSPYAPSPGGGGECADAIWKYECDEAREALSDEDTEEAAMDRAESTAGPWTEWGRGGCCTSKSARAPGVRVFTYRQAQYRIRALGKPGQLVNVEITFTRSFADGSSGSNYSEIRQFSAIKEKYAADDDSDYQVFDVTAPAGGVTCMAGAQLYLP